MAKKKAHALSVHTARLLAAAFAAIILLGGTAAFSIGFTGALERSFVNPAASLDRFSQALVWSQAVAIAALSLLCFVLFALAWYLRERLIAPLEKLKRSLVASAAGTSDEPIWGVTRRDEIGAVARAAESLRVSGEKTPSRLALRITPEVAERLVMSAERLEQHVVRIPEIAEEMRERVEEASLRAAKASHMAAEAASLTRETVIRIEEGARQKDQTSKPEPRDAAEMMERSARQLAETIARFENRLNAASYRSMSEDPENAPLRLFIESDSRSGETFPSLPAAPDFSQSAQPTVIGPIRGGNAADGVPPDGAVVLEDLIGNLDALERFASERKVIAEDEAVAFMAALIEAIDRLNSVADRICATADQTGIRAAE